MADFADDAILGTALELDKEKLSPDALFKRLRALIFRGLADHEIGHTVGLRHNFSASSDALNYRDEYWRVHETTAESTWESEHKLSEHAYASVMDYGARFNSDVQGLGKYDSGGDPLRLRAAVRHDRQMRARARGPGLPATSP